LEETGYTAKKGNAITRNSRGEREGGENQLRGSLGAKRFKGGGGSETEELSSSCNNNRKKGGDIKARRTYSRKAPFN